MCEKGSAAACRGGSSSSTADKIARFLVALAAKTKPVLPFSSESDKYLDLEKFDAVSVESLQLAAASAYGSMLSVEGVKPLMKQRLTYASFKYTRSTYEKFRDQAMSGQAVVALDVGLLAVVCHVICCNDLSRIDRTTQHQLAFLVIEGLSSIPTIPNTENQSSIKLLVLAAVLKLICVAPSSVPVSIRDTIQNEINAILTLRLSQLVEWVPNDFGYRVAAGLRYIRSIFRSSMQAPGSAGFGRNGAYGRCKSVGDHCETGSRGGTGFSDEPPIRASKTSCSRCTERLVCIGLIKSVGLIE